MPGMDKTGPLGTGPIGRGLGPCGGGQASRGRRGNALGGRIGRGIGQNLNPQADEKEILERQKTNLESHLNRINQRLQELQEKN